MINDFSGNTSNYIHPRDSIVFTEDFWTNIALTKMIGKFYRSFTG